LRFLAYKLELDERQVGELARILDELKTERAQAEVDRRRSLSAFADAVAGDTFDDARAKQAAGQRVATAERLRDAVTGALGRMHALLDKDQRERLAYLIRTGVLTL
jgi:Spy/CpxP family protein refolding chaperone